MIVEVLIGVLVLAGMVGLAAMAIFAMIALTGAGVERGSGKGIAKPGATRQ